MTKTLADTLRAIGVTAEEAARNAAEFFRRASFVNEGRGERMTERNLVSENTEGQLVLSDGGEIVEDFEHGEGNINMTALRRFAELSKRKSKLDGDLEETKKEMAKLEEMILKDFENNSIDNMKVDGMTIYHHSQVWASAKDKDTDTACKVLKEFEQTSSFVKENFNTQTVSAWVRERLKAVEAAEKAAYAALEKGDQAAYEMHMREREIQDIPEEIKDVLKISEVPSIRARKA